MVVEDEKAPQRLGDREAKQRRELVPCSHRQELVLSLPPPKLESAGLQLRLERDVSVTPTCQDRHAVRDRLVPLNRKYPLDSILNFLRESEAVTPRRPVFFEYTLIEGVNDSLDDARRLPGLLWGIPSKLNLIPMNAHPSSPFRAPSEETIDAFMRVLAGAGMTVTLRRSRGDDIGAACGQLALHRVGGAAA